VTAEAGETADTHIEIHDWVGVQAQGRIVR
jgi:hypothetical protein